MSTPFIWDIVGLKSLSKCELVQVDSLVKHKILKKIAGNK